MMNEPKMIVAEGVVMMDAAETSFAGKSGVVVEGGMIRDVGSVGELRTRWGNLEEEYVAGVMLPGMINPHTHLELGYQRGAGAGSERPGHFTEWVGKLMKHYPPAEKVEAVVSDAVRAGVWESLRAGVTMVGDISRQVGVTRRELGKLPLRAISFGEVVGLGKMRGRWEGMMDQAVDRTFETERVKVGVSPHAPYTVEGPTLKQVIARAVREGGRGVPVTMHLGELVEEREFLATLGGKLGRDWEVMVKLDVMDDSIPTCAEGVMAWAEKWGLLEAAKHVPVVLAHVNYCGDEELRILARSGAGVVYCPRTHAYFGHPRTHRYREMREAGIKVALGTDSLASSPDLDVRQEARLVWERDRAGAFAAMEMVTRAAGEVLGAKAGMLERGFFADLVVFETDGAGRAEDVCARVLSGAAVRGVWVGGERVV